MAIRWRLARRSIQLLQRLAVETEGQDVIEYALGTAFMALAGAAVWDGMQTGLGDAYGGLNEAVWGLWDPADPE